MVGKKVEPNSGLAAACGIGEFGVSAIPDAITPYAGRDLKSRPENLDVEPNKKPWRRGNILRPASESRKAIIAQRITQTCATIHSAAQHVSRLLSLTVLLLLFIYVRPSFAAGQTKADAWASCQAWAATHFDGWYSGAVYSCASCQNSTGSFPNKNCVTAMMNYPSNNTAPFPYPWGLEIYYCTTPDCDSIPKDPPGCPLPTAGNPINIATSNKILDENDYIAPGVSPLKFTRYFNSLGSYQYQATFGTRRLTEKALGVNWSHNYFKGLTVSASDVRLTLPSGQTFRFTPSSGSWLPDADVNYRLTELLGVNNNRTGWKVTNPNDSVETYDLAGNLLKIVDRDGNWQTLAYSVATTATTVAAFPGLLIKVTDNFGNVISFTYKGSKLMSLTDPVGNVTTYAYDAKGNLKTVTYPDDTPTVLTDNPKKTYVYGGDNGEAANVSSTPNSNVIYTYSLTGILDENNIRYATYRYDANGKAISTEHAGSVEKYSLAYAPDGTSTAVTDPLGSIRTTHFTTVLGVVKPTGTDQPGGSGCSAASNAVTYDANGNTASRTDFNGHKACYAYDLARNLETARVEGLPSVADCSANLTASSLPAPARKVTTSWHPSYRLPLLIAEPKQLTTYTYDASGNVLTHKEQATTDLTGVAGFTSAVTGVPRTWTYTYNSLG